MAAAANRNDENPQSRLTIETCQYLGFNCDQTTLVGVRMCRVDSKNKLLGPRISPILLKAILESSALFVVGCVRISVYAECRYHQHIPLPSQKESI